MTARPLLHTGANSRLSGQLRRLPMLGSGGGGNSHLAIPGPAARPATRPSRGAEPAARGYRDNLNLSRLLDCSHWSDCQIITPEQVNHVPPPARIPVRMTNGLECNRVILFLQPRADTIPHTGTSHTVGPSSTDLRPAFRPQHWTASATNCGSSTSSHIRWHRRQSLRS